MPNFEYPLQEASFDPFANRSIKVEKFFTLDNVRMQILQSEDAKKYFIRCAKQAPGIARIDMKQLKSLSVLIPPLADQMRFVFLFQAIDKSKLAIQKSIDELEILKESFMQAYFG